MVILIEGKLDVKITKTDDKGNQVVNQVATIGVNQTVGQNAITEKEPQKRSASVTANTECVVLELLKVIFDQTVY